MTEQPLHVGDTVAIGPNRTNAPVGAIGIIHAFSTAGKANTPIVDVPERGRYLVARDALTRHDAPPISRNGAEPADDPPASPVSASPVPADPAPPAFDWFERPAPSEETTMPRTGWTPERRERYEATIARKKAEQSSVRLRTPHADDADPPPRSATVAPAPAPRPEPALRTVNDLTIREPDAVQRLAAAPARQFVPERAIAPMDETPVLAAIAAPGIGSLDDELAASLAALRRGVAAAAIEGRATGTITRLVSALASLEQAVAGAGEGP